MAEHHPPVFSNSDWWGTSPEFKHRKGRSPQALSAFLATPSFSAWDTYARGQDDRFSPPISCSLSPTSARASGLRPASRPHGARGSSLVLFSLLGPFPSLTFSFFSFSSCFTFTQESSPQGHIPVGPSRRPSRWSVPSGMPCLPGMGGWESKARQPLTVWGDLLDIMER